MVWCAVSYGNPVAIPKMPPLSEIYIVNDNNWIVEVDCRKFTNLRRPCQTDTFTLFCSPLAIQPQVPMQSCIGPEIVDSNGIALLRSQQFPQVMLKKGWYLMLGLKNQSGIDSVWQAHIPDTLTEPFSIISRYFINPCCSGATPDDCNGCAVLEYISPVCPSIGTFNDSAFGSITGKVRGSDGIPLANIEVFPTTTMQGYATDMNGIYKINKLDSCQVHSLRFLTSDGYWIDTTVGPIKISIGHTITVNVNLNYKIATNILSSGKTESSQNKIRFLQTGTGQQIVLSVLQSTLGKGMIDLFSADGKSVRSLPIAFDNSGTYTVKWDGCDDRHKPVSMGKYGCRVQINGETMCSGFVVK